jgi:hypothetical protein
VSAVFQIQFIPNSLTSWRVDATLGSPVCSSHSDIQRPVLQRNDTRGDDYDTEENNRSADVFGSILLGFTLKRQRRLLGRSSRRIAERLIARPSRADDHTRSRQEQRE